MKNDARQYATVKAPAGTTLGKEIARADDRARRDALRHMADLPDPRAYAWNLTGKNAALVLSAAYRHGPLWRCRVNYLAPLRTMGLVEVGGTYFGAFGSAVIEALRSGEA
jgi:hypothetical protein